MENKSQKKVANKHLNIIDRNGVTGSGWQSIPQLNPTDIASIKDKSAKGGNALNAIPSPFSRMHIFETAFKLLSDDLTDKKDRTSKVYKELASDCLDAIELLFNLKYHQSQGDQLEIIKWSKNKDLKRLKEEGFKGQKVFAKTIERYMEQDFAEGFNDLFIIKYKYLILGGTSPLTLMFTSPNLDKKDGAFRNPSYKEKFDLINPSTGYKYFTEVVPLDRRSPKFRRYLHKLFVENDHLKQNCKVLWDYINDNNVLSDDNRNLTLRIQPIKTVSKDVVTVLNVPLKFDNDSDAMDIFLDHIIKVSYPINKDYFFTPTYIDDDENRDFDFLIPIQTEFLQTISPEDIPKLVSYEIRGEHTVKVTVKHPSDTKKYEKTFFSNKPDNKLDGSILDYKKELELIFTVGIYPFLKVVEDDGTPSDLYNDYYKILLGLDSSNSFVKNESFDLDFFRSTETGFEEIIRSDEGTYNSKRYDRTKLEETNSIGSIFYQVNNTFFDYIRFSGYKVKDISNPEGWILPRWKPKKIGNKQFDFSVDFGTTSTFIAYTDDHSHEAHPVPFSITDKDMQMVLLNSPRKLTSQNITQTFRGGQIASIARQIITQEFIPSVIIPDEKDTFTLPFRTAVYEKKNLGESEYQLLDNINVNFAYQRSDLFTEETQEIVSNLKWSIQNDRISMLRVEFYLEEILRLLRNKVLLNSGNPIKTNVTYFIPQSLTPNAIHTFDRIWRTQFNDVLKSKGKLRKVSESEAPYYYLGKKSDIKNRDCVLTVDIGGGSTDISVFKQDRLTIGTSFNFAGNIFWGNGYNEFKNIQDNGIFKDLRDVIYDRIKSTPLKKSFDDMVKQSSTEEIINFWIANDDKTLAIKELGSDRYKFLYLLHFSSIIYHSSQLLKSNKIEPATCIIFSGNGSKYIDFLNIEDTLSKIAGFIQRKVFNVNADNPQIILPLENRKESTCFGGLYKNDDHKIETVTYLGTTLNYGSIKSIKTYQDLFSASDILTNVEENIKDFFEILISLNDEINFKAYYNIDLKVARLRNFLLKTVHGNLMEGYSKRKAKVEPDDEISDSLFFYPLVGLIYQLTQIDNEALRAYEPSTLFYSNCPDGKELFFQSRLKSDKFFDSVFQIEVFDSNPNEAEFIVIKETPVFKRAISSISDILDPVADYDEYPDTPDQIIEVVKKGKLKKQGDQWLVTEKMKVKFI